MQTSVVTANFNVGSLLGYTVSVSSRATTTNGARIVSTVWNWGDNTAVSTTSSAAHNYRLAGTYSITLTARDSNNNVGSRSVSITLPPDNPPVASYTVSKRKEIVTFDATTSASRYGTIASFRWDFGDGTIRTIPTTTINFQRDAVVTHTYASSNNYTVVLTVTDSRNAIGSTTKVVEVFKNVQPIADFRIVNTFGYLVNVESNCTDPDGYVVDWEWIWGDGTPNDYAPSTSHEYTTAGTYTISLIATDENRVRSVEKNITVEVPLNLPIASFTVNVSRKIISFNASQSVSPLGSIQTYNWNFGESSSASNTLSTS